MLKIEEISLASCSYHFFPVASEEQEADISISFFTKPDPIKCNDIFRMTVFVGFCVISENSKTECNYLVNYTADTEEQFSVLQDKVIVSHIIPYLRVFRGHYDGGVRVEYVNSCNGAIQRT